MNPIIQRMRNRLLCYDRNLLGIFAGPTGSGKSESALRLALLLNPDFTTDHVVFTVEDFFSLLNSNTLKAGDVIVWEEMGIAADSRTFFSLQNRAITYVFESFRFKNLAVLMNVPGLRMIDSRVQRLCHYYFETVKIMRRKKLCRNKVFELQYNGRNNKIYFHYPEVVLDGVVKRVEALDFLKPPDYIVEPYLDLKRKFTEELNIGLELQIKDAKIDKSSKPKDVSAIVAEVVSNPGDYIHIRGGERRVKVGLIQGIFDVGRPTAAKARDLIEHKLMREDSGF